MRVTRSLLLICAVALAAAGCTRVQYAAAPPPAQQGIDNVVYGATPAPAAPAAYNGSGPPYRGLMGALKVRDDIEVVVDARLPVA